MKGGVLSPGCHTLKGHDDPSLLLVSQLCRGLLPTRSIPSQSFQTLIAVLNFRMRDSIKPFLFASFRAEQGRYGKPGYQTLFIGDLLETAGVVLGIISLQFAVFQQQKLMCEAFSSGCRPIRIMFDERACNRQENSIREYPLPGYYKSRQ
eukprot:scaffold26562_cov103-Cylindrotheca_fusiformis.AAC.2